MKTAHDFFFKLNCIFHFNLLDLIKKNIQTAISIPCNCIYILLSKGFENVSNFHNACT